MKPMPLSPSGESAWQSLQTHLEWSQGFWLGWLFTDHLPSAHALSQRAGELLAEQRRGVDWWVAQTPEELAQILVWLLKGAEGATGSVWIAIGQRSPDWKAAWENFLLRLNERRELLRRTIPGGVVLVAPTAFKAMTREAAPDLWSIRSLVMEVGAGPEDQGRRQPSRSSMRPRQGPIPQGVALELAQQAVEEARRRGDPDTEATALLRVAVAYGNLGRFGEAREVAGQLSSPALKEPLRSAAYALQGKLASDAGDFDAAEGHLRQAMVHADGTLVTVAARQLAYVLLRRGAHSEALALAEQLVRRGPGDTTRSQEAMNWTLLGDTRLEVGDTSGARDAYVHALDLHARSSSVGDSEKGATLDTLWDLRQLGSILYRSKDYAGAMEVFLQRLSRLQSYRDEDGVLIGRQSAIAEALMDVGGVNLAQFQHRQGGRYLMEAAEQLEQVGGDIKHAPDLTTRLAAAFDQLAAQTKDPAEAQSYREKAESLLARLP